MAELVRGRDEQGQALSDQEILDNLRLMIFAGHETTASVMAWSASYLALRPELFQAIREEARTLEGLPQTPLELRTYRYAEGLFREVLRVHQRWTPSFGQVFVTAKVESGVMIQATLG